MMSFKPLRLPLFSSVLVSQIAAASDQECSTQRDTVLLQTQNVRMQTVASDGEDRMQTVRNAQPSYYYYYYGDGEDTVTDPPVADPVVADDPVAEVADTGSHEAVNICRFARLPDIWDGLENPDNTDLQNDYIAATLRWDGKFASPKAAVTMEGMTRDHMLLDDDGQVKRIAGYTAPSKENLHLSMLAVVVDDVSPVAWNFVIDYALKSQDPPLSAADFTDVQLREMAKQEAFHQLTTIIAQYESWRDYCPGCGGFLNWFWVDDDGITHDETSGKVKGVPALDNGQMAWSMVAVHQVLFEKAAVFTENGDTTSADLYQALATKYQDHIDVMAASANDLFVKWKGQQKRSSNNVDVKEKDKPVGDGAVKQKGMLRDPFEGELMIMFETLMATGVADNAGAKKRLWKKVKRGVQRREYTGPDGDDNCLPAGVGPITVESGWRFSAHEQWKYLIMPYRDNEYVDRLFSNGERARSWDSHCRNLPGFLAAAYRPPHHDSTTGEPVYMDTLGIPSLSYGFTEPAVTDRVVTPYGAFPLILASRGTGLAWHRTLLAQNMMQSQFGSMESLETDPVDGHARAARIMTWDTKVSTDLAMVGGTTEIIKRALTRLEMYDTFLENVAHQMEGFGEITGESAGFAPAPEVPEAAESFADCKLE